MRKLIFGTGALILLFISFLIIPKTNAYVYNGHKWNATSRSYLVDSASFTCCTAANVISDIQKAAAAWTLQTQANFTFTYGGTTTGATMVNDGVSKVFGVSGTSPYGSVAEVYWWYDGTGNLVDADMKFWLDSVTWKTESEACTSTAEWIYQVGTHEFGHYLSLGHTDVIGATMFSGIGYCDTNEYTLEADDILAIETLYGRVPSPSPSPSPSPVPAPTPTPVPQPPPPTGGAVLYVRAYKARGLQKVDLTWSGLTTSTADVYRNNSKILAGTSNDGFQTDAINKKGGGSYSYRVCELNSADNCTNDATASF